jgi:hypothetical protein
MSINRHVMDLQTNSISYATHSVCGIHNSASSVLQKNVKLYGPMNALDVTNGSSSWNSEGNSQNETTLTVHFGRAVIPTSVRLQFQAGFSAETIVIHNPQGVLIGEMELEDIHEIQTHSLINNDESFTSLKFTLDNFSDFYGRVILYRLEVWGYEIASIDMME